MISASGNGQSTPHSFEVRILRQNGPGEASYWERHRVPHQQDMNVISVLQSVAAQAETADGRTVAPVAWDCNCLEEVCGACTMVINGRVRQACSAIVDRLLDDNPQEIELRPMTKFPVVRDLVVDRGRMFNALSRVKAWVNADGYYDLGPGPLVPRNDQEQIYPLSQCMSCGCCLEACPQYTKVEIQPQAGESQESLKEREDQAYSTAFLGPQAISQAVLFNLNPAGKSQASERLEALSGPGGLQICGNAQNCVAVCPKEIPLTTSIARAGRATTVHAFKKWFDR
ncbi:MAG: succinate dehydrogenase iron-sulfur subunit [Pirellulaceae bacterium]|nr:succinate dehydrogenase iron-sulfur subunit [Pirellulaceae bacterium]